MRSLPEPDPAVPGSPGVHAALPVHGAPQPVAGPDGSAPDLFFGSLGLRAGWSIALFLTIAAVFLMCGIAVVTFFYRPPAASPTSPPAASHTASNAPPGFSEESASAIALNDAVLLLAVAGSAFALARLERRSVAVYGLGRQHLADALPGALTGLVLLSVLVAILRALHLLAFGGLLLPRGPALRSGLAWLLTFALVGLFEEYFFRGYLQYTLTRGLLGLSQRLSPEHARTIAFTLSAVLLSGLFCLGHVSNSGETTAGLSATFLAGLVLSYALWRTGSLWWGVGFHTTWDWAQSFLFGVADSGKISAGRLFATHPVGNPLLSGGAAGPEGSLLVLPTLLAVVLVLQAVRHRAQPPLQPDAEDSRLHDPINIF